MDNSSVIEGTIQLWEQWAGSSHNLDTYEGGYGYINMLTTARAYQYAGIPIADQVQTQGIKTPTFYIPVGQSFFVQVVQDGTIAFNNGQRVFKQENASESVFFRNGDNEETTTNSEAIQEENIFQLIRLEFSTSEGSSRRFVLGFGEAASDGYDYGLDGGRVENLFMDDMGSLLNGEQYVIQALSPITTDKEVNLALNASGNFTYSLKMVEAQNLSNDQELYLKDNYTGTYFDLKSAQEYSFTSDAGLFNDRFSIVFESPDTLSNEDFSNNNTLIYVNQVESRLYVKELNQNAKQLNIANMLGQTVISFTDLETQALENGIDVSNLSSGIYLVSVKTDNNKSIDKKVIIN